MFWCLPPSGKCEWANLKKFAVQFNDTYATKYRLSKCLDVSDSSKPQPEVLLESDGDRCMVIERKSVVWPPDYFKFHRFEHDFQQYFVRQVATAFQDDVYLLEINSNDLRGGKAHLRDLAQQIAIILLANRTEIVVTGEMRSSRPINWYFRRVPEHERDADTPSRGVGTYFYETVTIPENPEELQDAFSNARQGVAARLNELLGRVEEKFINYPDCLRVLVLEFYGDDWLLDDDDITSITQNAELPAIVDQIWLAEPEWTSESDFQILYRQVRVNNLDQTDI